MIRLRIFFAIVALGLCTAVCAAPTSQVVQIPQGDFVTLCFHEVAQGHVAGSDGYAMSTQNLARWFDWMQENDWHPVSMQQVIDAHAGGAPLPRNAVLLSFDDGLESTYTEVFPLLQAYHYPAVFALETGWMRRVHGGDPITPPDGSEAAAQRRDERQAAHSSNLREPGEVYYNGAERGAEGFLTWAQVRDMQASGLIEFATHTDNLHHGIRANPQGNVEPAAVTRLYNAKTHRYETDAQFHQRVRDDLLRSSRIIARHTGRPTRVVVWPYGAVTQEVLDIAHGVGLSVSMSLADRHVSRPRDLHNLGRFLITGDPQPAQIQDQIGAAVTPQPQVQRAVQVDLDAIYDPDPKQVNRNLGKLLDRMKAMQVRTVYLQAFADPDGDGTASALYFPNRHLPMRADLFNRVAWQLKTRAGVQQVYAWLPLLAYDLPDKALQKRLDVKIRGQDGRPVVAHRDYRRLSPFLPQSQRIVGDIYADLGRSASDVDGVLIHDDAYLGADEDATSCSARARWPGTDRRIHACQLSARRKTMALIDFGQAAIRRLHRHVNLSNPFHSARNLYARVVMDPAAEARFAQALGPFLSHYNEVVLMAMPYLDGTDQAPGPWLDTLARKVAAHPGALHKVVFELQTRDWRGKGHWIAGHTLRDWMTRLIRDGALNLAYYPDDFLGNHPPLKTTFTGISVNDFPHTQGGQ